MISVRRWLLTFGVSLANFLAIFGKSSSTGLDRHAPLVVGPSSSGNRRQGARCKSGDFTTEVGSLPIVFLVFRLVAILGGPL